MPIVSRVPCSAGALLFLALLSAAHAGNEAGFSAGVDKLTGGRDEWQNQSAFVDHKSDDGTVSGLRANATRRFGLDDTQLEGFINFAVADRLRLGIDANASPTHRVLARHAIGGSLQYEFAPAWLLHGGARQTRYDAVTVDQLSTGVEHYFGNWGAALSVIDSSAYGTHTQTLMGRLSHYYGDRDRINVLLATGREPISLAGTIVNSDVKSVTLTGRHWFRPTMAIDYSVGTASQNGFYSRTGASLGLVVAF